LTFLIIYDIINYSNEIITTKEKGGLIMAENISNYGIDDIDHLETREAMRARI